MVCSCFPTGVQGPALHVDGHTRRLQARFPAGRASPQRLLGTDRCCCCWPELDACWQLTQRRCHPVWPQEALQSSHSPVTHLRSVPVILQLQSRQATAVPHSHSWMFWLIGLMWMLVTVVTCRGCCCSCGWWLSVCWWWSRMSCEPFSHQPSSCSQTWCTVFLQTKTQQESPPGGCYRGNHS